MAERFDVLAAMAGAKEMLEDTGEIPPLLFVTTRADQENLMVGLAGGGADWATFDGRAQVMATVGGILAKKGIEPIDVALLSDVWMTMVEDGEKYNPDIPPSRDPNRKEAITVASLSSEGETGYAQRTYERTEAGIVWTQGEPEWQTFPADDDKNKIKAFLLEHFWRGYRTQADPMGVALDAIDAKEGAQGEDLFGRPPAIISPDEHEALRRMVASRFTQNDLEATVDQDPTD